MRTRTSIVDLLLAQAQNYELVSVARAARADAESAAVEEDSRAFAFQRAELCRAQVAVYKLRLGLRLGDIALDMSGPCANAADRCWLGWIATGIPGGGDDLNDAGVQRNGRQW